MRVPYSAFALFAAAALLPTAAGASTIHVLSAVYGTPSAGHVCNAAAPVASLCNGKHECAVDIRNNALCGDPDFLVVKQIDITYQCGHHRYSSSGAEYYLSSLACR